MHLREQVIQPADPSYRLIALTKGKIAVVDAEDYDWLMRRNWYARFNKSNNSFYAAYGVKDGRRCQAFHMHRVVMGLPNESVLMIDHRDHDTLNNRKENLRIVTRSQNMMNMKTPFTSKSGIKGVHWCRRDKRWIAVLKIDGATHRIGRFPSMEEAALAYRTVAPTLQGEFYMENA